MGNDQTTLNYKDTNSLNVNKYVSISAQHNKKLYKQNVKTFQEFSFTIKSIHLRASYLNYEWAKWLCYELKKDLLKLYDQYCDMFKQSLLNKRRAFHSFYIKNLDSKFYESFQTTSKILQKRQISSLELDRLFEEVKCYYMVQNWFFDLPLNSYSQKKQKAEDSKENAYSDKIQSNNQDKRRKVYIQKCKDEKTYLILLKLTEIFFQQNYYQKQINFKENYIVSTDLSNFLKNFTPIEVNLIKAISKVSSFKARQTLISELLQSIIKTTQKGCKYNEQYKITQKKLSFLVKILGLKNVYCVLKILKEIGAHVSTQKIEKAFEFIQRNFISLKDNPESGSDDQNDQNNDSLKDEPLSIRKSSNYRNSVPKIKK